jgi:TusA-related sulfurtransferase
MDTPHQVLDCRDELCPGPVILVSKALKNMALDQVLEVHATDPGAVPDMEALAKQTGQQILGVVQEPDRTRIQIRRLR